jgi:hypothetical protein
MTTTPPGPAACYPPDDPHQSGDGLILRSPDALVAALPYLVGFAPHESAVLVWLRRGRILLTQRIDLLGPAEDCEPWHAAVWGHAGAPEADELILVLVTSRTDAAGVAELILAEAEERGLLVRDALRVDAGRWWSLLCTDPSCCGLEGRPVDEAVLAEVSAEFTLTGAAPLADRESMVRAMCADPMSVAAVDTRVAVIIDLTARLAQRALEKWRNRTIEEILSILGRLPGAADGGRLLEADEVATLVAGLRDMRVRDTVLWECARLDRDQRRTVVSVLTVGLRSAPAGAVAPIATCCGLVAWLTGDGARASVAVERALRDDPAYSLAQLLAQSLAAGLPPEAWQRATAGLTRIECRHGSAASPPAMRRRAS